MVFYSHMVSSVMFTKTGYASPVQPPNCPAYICIELRYDNISASHFTGALQRFEIACGHDSAATCPRESSALACADWKHLTPERV